MHIGGDRLFTCLGHLGQHQQKIEIILSLLLLCLRWPRQVVKCRSRLGYRYKLCQCKHSLRKFSRFQREKINEIMHTKGIAIQLFSLSGYTRNCMKIQNYIFNLKGKILITSTN